MTIGSGAVGAVLLFRPDLSSRPDGVCQLFEHVDRGGPVDAGVGDADALLERGETTLGWDLLVALIDVGLDHDADDGLLALTELVADSLSDLGLVPVVLARVAFIS